MTPLKFMHFWNPKRPLIFLLTKELLAKSREISDCFWLFYIFTKIYLWSKLFYYMFVLAVWACVC